MGTEEEAEGQGAGCRGEENRLLSSRPCKVISNSPLLPLFFWGWGTSSLWLQKRRKH